MCICIHIYIYIPDPRPCTLHYCTLVVRENYLASSQMQFQSCSNVSMALQKHSTETIRLMPSCLHHDIRHSNVSTTYIRAYKARLAATITRKQKPEQPSPPRSRTHCAHRNVPFAWRVQGIFCSKPNSPANLEVLAFSSGLEVPGHRWMSKSRKSTQKPWSEITLAPEAFLCLGRALTICARYCYKTRA